MSDWTQATLGEVAQVVGGGTPNTKQPNYWGGDILWLTPGELTKREGQVITSTERTISEAGLKGSSAKMLPAGTVLLTSRATVGAVGLAGQPMATNQGFQSLIAGEGVLPRFLMYWVQANRSEFESRASGSTFPEISGKKVKDIPILLPPVAEQRRIAAVTHAMDQCVDRLATEVDAQIALMGAVGEEVLALPGSSGTPIADLLSRNIGGVWGSSPGADEVDVDVFRSTEFTDLGWLVTPADARRSITKKQFAGRELAAGDILIEKSGGTPTRSVGRVVRVPHLSQPAVGANFLNLLRADRNKVDPDYLFWVLWTAHRRGDGFEYQQASTNIRNLKTKDYLARPIDLPDRATQERAAVALNGLHGSLAATQEQLQRSRSLRRGVLAALLSREIAVDAAVDQFSEGAA